MTKKTTLRPTGQSGKNLRTLLEKRPLTIMGAPFPLAAKEIERQGFPAVYLSGAALSAGLLGIPDIGLIPFETLEQQTLQLTKNVTIPVIVDADTGYGDVHTIERNISRLEAAGAAAIQIEDQATDRRCGHLNNKQVISQAEMSEKIQAACEGRRSTDTIIIARTDVRGGTSMKDCLSRMEAYHDAGADWLFPEALHSKAEFSDAGQLLKKLKTPGLANMTEFGQSPLLSSDELNNLGFAAVLYPVTLLRLAMKAIQIGLDVLADEKCQESLLNLMQTRDELYDLLDYDPSLPSQSRPSGTAR
ncbi:MAG: isocitrate lyase/PEP mutase family protein [Pirellulales bacterium]